MIEFLFENRRYFDVRRWDIYEKTEKEPIMGMNIETAEPDYYSKVVVNHSRVRNRIVNKKMIYFVSDDDQIYTSSIRWTTKSR